MTAEELWQAYRKINPGIGDEIDAWALGFNRIYWHSSS